MGCCQSKKENTIDNVDGKKDPHSEAAALKHPQADANKSKKDEEAGKKPEASPQNPTKQPVPDTKKNESPQLPKKEVYEDATKGVSKAEVAGAKQTHEAPKPQANASATSGPKGIPESIPKTQAGSPPIGNSSPAKNPETKPLNDKPKEMFAETHSNHNQAGANTNKNASGAPPLKPEAPKPKQEAGKKSDKPFSIKEILDVFNDVRSNPSKYADRVQILYLDHINEKNVNMRTKIMTNEGKTPYIEAKKFLSSQKPLKKCELDDGLTAAAYLHSVYAAELDQLTHQGRGGRSTMDRIKEFGVMQAGMCAENILNRREVTPEEWILDFVIDDGVTNRGHRKNIFNDQVTKVGLGVARKNHQSEWYFTMDFSSDGYKSDKSKIPANVLEESGLADFHRETNS